MSQVQLVKFRFKPGKKQVWLDWSKELMRRKAEVMATLRDEGVLSESCYISENGEEIYYFMEVEDFDKVLEVVRKSPHPIDHDHRLAKKESIERVGVLECLFQFENPAGSSNAI